MSQYKLTVTGTLDTSYSEEDIRRDFPMFVSALAQVHGDAVRDSITLVSVERLPDPEPPVVDQDPINAILATLQAITDRLERLERASQ